MTILVLIAKVTILLAIASAAVYGLRHSAAELRHRIWACALGASLALPLLMFTLPAWRSATVNRAIESVRAPLIAGPTIRTVPAMKVDAGMPVPWLRRPGNLALVLWIGGFALMALRLLHGLASLSLLRSRAQPVFEESWMRHVMNRSRELGIKRPVRLLAARDTDAMPLTWGILRPAILLPAGAPHWTVERRDMVLAHELAHIARHDWAWQICAEVVRAVYWFHPLAWFAANRLRLESERAADDAVLNAGARPSEYATELLELARTLKNNGRVWSTALAMARNSHLERRFIAMLNPTVNRRRTSRRTALVTTLGALAVLLPLAALNSPAQDRSGHFTGSIYDPRGAAIPNATVILSNPKTLTKDMTTANAAGKYSFTGIPAGSYEMTVLQPGFSPYKMTIGLDAGRDAEQDASLVLGALNERIEVVGEGPFAATGTASTPAKIRVGGNVQAANLMRQVKPPYPASAKAAGIQGSVLLQALIGTDGAVRSLQVLNSQIDPDLARASVEAVSQWVYKPTLLNGEPTEVVTNITVNFTLQP